MGQLLHMRHLASQFIPITRKFSLVSILFFSNRYPKIITVCGALYFHIRRFCYSILPPSTSAVYIDLVVKEPDA